MSVEFKLLGPIQVVVDGEPVTPSSRMQRVLLAVLMLQANRTVTIERLKEILWDRPPASSHANLRTHISFVRKALRRHGEDRMIRQLGGYRLEVMPGELDLDEFRRMAARGRSLVAVDDLAGGCRALGQAVALGRGPAGSCLNAEGQLADQLAALNTERLQVFEEWIDIRLQLGEASAVVGAVHAHVADHPTREYAWGQLMRATYYAGDVAAALRAFSQARHMLVGQLGIEPGQQLRSLQRAILDRDEAVLEPRRFRRPGTLAMGTR